MLFSGTDNWKADIAETGIGHCCALQNALLEKRAMMASLARPRDEEELAQCTCE